MFELRKVRTKNAIKYILQSILSGQESRVCSWFYPNCPMSRSSYSIPCDAKRTQDFCQMRWSWTSTRVCLFFLNKKKNFTFWKIFSPAAGGNDISVGKCGSLRAAKWKMTIGDNVSMNCAGNSCFPGCKDPNKVAWTPHVAACSWLELLVTFVLVTNNTSSWMCKARKKKYNDSILC